MVVFIWPTPLSKWLSDRQQRHDWLDPAGRDSNGLNPIFFTNARWTGAGKRQLATGDNQHRQGVALIIQKKKGNTLLEWKPINERPLYARFKSRFIKLSVVTCYAPTEEAEQEEKDNFYDSLQSTLEDVPKHDVLVVLGDFNAGVGSDNIDRERIMGKHGINTMTDNGSRLCDICGENDLVIGGTLF